MLSTASVASSRVRDLLQQIDSLSDTHLWDRFRTYLTGRNSAIGLRLQLFVAFFLLLVISKEELFLRAVYFHTLISGQEGEGLEPSIWFSGPANIVLLLKRLPLLLPWLSVYADLT